MAEDDNQTRSQMLNGVFDATQAVLVTSGGLGRMHSPSLDSPLRDRSLIPVEALAQANAQTMPSPSTLSHIEVLSSEAKALFVFGRNIPCWVPEQEEQLTKPKHIYRRPTTPFMTSEWTNKNEEEDIKFEGANHVLSTYLDTLPAAALQFAGREVYWNGGVLAEAGGQHSSEVIKYTVQGGDESQMAGFTGNRIHGKIKIVKNPTWQGEWAESDQEAWKSRYIVVVEETSVLIDNPENIPPQTTIKSVKPLTEVFDQEIAVDTGNPVTYNGQRKTVKVSLVPIDLIEVVERDQKWNKIPNPKNPPSYDNEIGLHSDLIRRVLFVAVEPSSGKVELTLKTSSSLGAGVAILCGVRDNTSPDSPVLAGSVPISPTGETDISFTPTGNLKDNERLLHRVVLGIDKNSDGQLGIDEVIANDAPLSERFYVTAVTQADYDNSLSYLDWRDNVSLFYPVAMSFVRYFDGNASSIDEAVALPSLVVPITEKANPSHIAGSPYNPSNGDTTIPKFKLPEGSTASNKIEETLARQDNVGLRAIVYNAWNANVANMAAPFEADSSLPSSTFGPVNIPTGTVISFYEDGPPSDLNGAYGGANIHGTVSFGLKRDPTNPLKVILSSVTINAVVDDMFDFDWTRKASSQSRKGATVQIGYQPPDRPGGRIFATETEVQRHYADDNAIWRFNNSWSIGLPTPTPGPPIVPPKSNE